MGALAGGVSEGLKIYHEVLALDHAAEIMRVEGQATDDGPLCLDCLNAIEELAVATVKAVVADSKKNNSN